MEDENRNKLSHLVSIIQEELAKFCEEHKYARRKYVDIVDRDILITVVVVLPDSSTKCYQTRVFNSDTAFKRIIEFEHKITAEME